MTMDANVRIDEETLKANTYYKYRNLKDFERFLDVVVNRRLYGAVYKELNDPMEGKFNTTGLEKKDFDEIIKGLRRQEYVRC